MTMVTLGVRDLAAARRFYEALGWQASGASGADFTIFRGHGALLALYGHEPLAAYAGVAPQGEGFRGVLLACNVATREGVAAFLTAAAAAGGRVVAAAHEATWGGHIGVFADLDGHLWEVAWNPHWQLSPAGHIVLTK